MGRTNPTSKSTLNEDTQIDFKHIVPQWFERLNKLFQENVDTNYFYGNTIQKLTITRGCVVGEAYGYDSSYAVAKSKNACQNSVKRQFFVSN